MEAFYKKLGTVFQKQRKSLKLTQSAVAEAVGVSRATLASFEVGQHRLLFHHALALAKILEVKLADVEGLYTNQEFDTALNSQRSDLREVILHSRAKAKGLCENTV